MKTIRLPASAYEENLPELLDQLAVGDAVGEVRLDFQNVSFWTPGALVSLLAKVRFWSKAGQRVVLDNCKSCGAFRYLQRINFFAQVGLQLSEEFRRRDAGGRFVELRQIGGGGGASVTDLATDIADCLVPDSNVDDPEESGLFDLLQYALSELANNVVQHAKAPGFAMAQYTARTDLIRLAISDHGIGILESFRETGSSHWTPELTDAEAITLALQSKISSKSHLSTPWGSSVNAGVGLTLLHALSVATGGSFLMASGQAVVVSKPEGQDLHKRLLRASFRGTLCAMAFPRARIRSFPDLLHKAKEAVGLLPSGGDFGRFFA